MPAAKPIYKDDVLRAMKFTKSNMAAARYLNVSYQHYRKFAKAFKLDESDVNSPTLFMVHKNQCGKGVRKMFANTKRKKYLLDIVKGRVEPNHTDPNRIKKAIIDSCLVEEKCSMCGFNEKRTFDKKAPLMLNFKDKNRKNFRLENLELLCYNCYFIYIGNVFTPQAINHQENYLGSNVKPIDWELDEHYQKIFEQNVKDSMFNVKTEDPKKPEDYGNEFISRY